jgi:hypothetical protein
MCTTGAADGVVVVDEVGAAGCCVEWQPHTSAPTIMTPINSFLAGRNSTAFLKFDQPRIKQSSSRKV